MKETKQKLIANIERLIASLPDGCPSCRRRKAALLEKLAKLREEK